MYFALCFTGLLAIPVQVKADDPTSNWLSRMECNELLSLHLENQLDMNTQMAEDAHNRISTLESNWEFKAEKLKTETDNAVEKLEFSIDNNKTSMTYKVEDFQRELLQVQKQLTMLEGITQSLDSSRWIKRINISTERKDYAIRKSNR